jgi:hypothetical protein
MMMLFRTSTQRYCILQRGDWASINAGLLDVVALFHSPSVASPYCSMKMLLTKKLKCCLGDIDTFVHTIFIYLRNNDECVGDTSTLFDLDSVKD